MIEDGRATGVVAGGETIAGSAVVIATDGPAAKALTGIASIPADGIGCTTVYLAGSRDPGIGKTLLLNGSGFGGVNHIAPLSNVAPSYAPQGQHLIAAVLLETPDLRGRNPDSIVQLARADAARMLGQNIEDWEAVSTVTVPFAQFRQPPGFVAHLPRNRTATRGLYLAGEYTVDSSINGALTSGLNAAEAILRDRGIFSRMTGGAVYKGEYKTPGGKLVGVRFALADGTLREVEVHGDFFLYPEDVLLLITAALEGAPADLDDAAYAERIAAADSRGNRMARVFTRSAHDCGAAGTGRRAGS